MDQDEEEWAQWQQDAEEDDEEPGIRMRPRTAVRWVPTFAQYVDEKVDRLALAPDGTVHWWSSTSSPATATPASAVVVRCDYRLHGLDATASAVWDSSILLSRFLLRHPEYAERFAACVELGAGCGLCGRWSLVLPYARLCSAGKSQA
jgi:hypothetical protein